ncbi:hypothetical protein [Kitasatospora sp. NPDC017646]|uniref:hypothetical protein n=1 Tax=Kitasatospora sp. NPDC017646 TaxID=3364024 RepID=UPI0037903FFC
MQRDRVEAGEHIAVASESSPEAPSWFTGTRRAGSPPTAEEVPALTDLPVNTFLAGDFDEDWRPTSMGDATDTVSLCRNDSR